MRRSVLLTLTLLAGCAYGFSGGGLPPGIRTAAVMPFENATSDPTIAQQVNTSVKEVIEQRLGLRSAAENQADVVVRGTVTRYEPDQPVAYRGTGGGPGQAQQVEVNRRLLQLTVEMEVIEVSTGENLLQRATFTVEAQYDSGRETEGRRTALDYLVTEIVKDAQSQW